MLSVRTPSLEDIIEIVKKYKPNMDINMEIPTMIFPFFRDETLVGYGKVTIVENIAKLIEFVIDDENRSQFGIFFLKGIGSKIADLGFESFIVKVNCNDIYQTDCDGKIILEKLFVGDCKK